MAFSIVHLVFHQSSPAGRADDMALIDQTRWLDLLAVEREVGGSNLSAVKGGFPNWASASVGRSNADASNSRPISRARLVTDVKSPRPQPLIEASRVCRAYSVAALVSNCSLLGG